MKMKKYIFISCVISLIMLALIVIVDRLSYQSYNRTVNKKLAAICDEISERYPDIKPSDIMEILLEEGEDTSRFFEKYGIDSQVDSAIKANGIAHKAYIIVMIVIIVVGISIPVLLAVFDRIKINKKIEEITQDVERINAKNYQLDIRGNTDEELSRLRTEVYKTMVMLKETSEASISDKLKLRDSLSDISHQLKTPITSLGINLENLSECDNEELRNKLIRNAERDVNRISSLVQLILKMSKLDAGTIRFIKKEVSIKSIIDEAIEKVEALADLRNILISVKGNDESFLCDPFWQVEALANIIKNAVEHAEKEVRITFEKNDVYTAIRVINDGECIDDEDRKHVFERFYKGKNASKESVGIGLALSKAIVEQDGGYISVDTDMGKTRFEIKYL